MPVPPQTLRLLAAAYVKVEVAAELAVPLGTKSVTVVVPPLEDELVILVPVEVEEVVSSGVSVLVASGVKAAIVAESLVNEELASEVSLA